jgi:hypothetical protein
VNARLPTVGMLRIAVAAVSLALCACNGSLGVNPLPSMPSSASTLEQNVGNALAPQRLNAKLQLQLAIPRKRGRPDRVPPTAQSIVVQEGSTKLGSFDTASTSRGCRTSTGLTLCTFTMNAIAGTNAVFDIKTYGAPGGHGHLLASASVAQTIVAHKHNTMSLTFEGAVASIEIVIEDANPFSGAAITTPVIVAAEDAAGATIVGPGKYVPIITLSDSDKSGATHLSTTKLTSASRKVTLAYDGSSSLSSATISATAPGIAPRKIKPAMFAPFTAAQITSALQSVESYYLTLPHRSVSSDLQAIAAHMTASGKFASATVATGGIDATFPNGAETLIFADKPEDLAGPYQQRRATSLRGAAVRAHDEPLSPPNSHEVAFLVNESGDRAFHPQRQQTFAAAFTADGFTSGNGYGVDALDVTLENIGALSTGHPIDFLDIATHGFVDKGGTYWWTSTTAPSPASLATYAKDLTCLPRPCTPNVATSTVLDAYVPYGPFFAFNANFLAKDLTFNPGAIIDNQSCHGQDQSIKNGPTQLRARGVGRYYGWTLAVIAEDADGTDAFMLDRLLGEQYASQTGLNQYATQRTPPQRPFPLDQVYDAMEREGRSGPLSEFSPGLPYNISELGKRLDSIFIYTDFGGESVAHPPIEYALPSIEYLAVDEDTSTLNIFGTFPSVTGGVAISNPSGTASPSPKSWTTTKIEVPVPAAGAGAWGLVSVIDGGIESNAVPLTLWSGTLAYVANGTLTSDFGQSGSGSLNETAAFNVAVRADVHQTVVNIDTTPEPQNLAFSNLENNSNGVGTAFNETFSFPGSGGCPAGGCNVTYGLASPAPTMAPPSTLDMGAQTSSSSAAPGPMCNDGLAGPQGNTNPNVFCAVLAFEKFPGGTTCSTNTTDPGLCAGYGYCFCSLGDSFMLTMDPMTDAITVEATPFPLTTFGGPSIGSGTATVRGTFAAPLSTPNPSAPSLRPHHKRLAGPQTSTRT